MIYKLKDHRQAQCHVVVYSDATIDFISYNTTVLECEMVNPMEYKIKCNGLYSMTTRKQIGWFLKEYFNSVSYYDIKKIAYTDDYIIAVRSW